MPGPHKGPGFLLDSGANEPYTEAMNPYDFAVQTVREAGALILRASEKGFETAIKGGDPRDIVTSVDTEANDYIIRAIKKNFPTHGIYSEEGGDTVAPSEYEWTIDPIDGSSNFSRGIPHFAVCLGLLQNGIPISGAIYNPVTNELFSFKKGGGAFLNEKPIHVSKITELSQAYVFLHAGRKPEVSSWGGESYRRLLTSARKTNNFASSSLDACFVAAGRIDANVYGTLSTLDIAPALGLLEEAGGVVRNEKGEHLTYSKDSTRIYMANSEALLETVRTLLESA